MTEQPNSHSLNPTESDRNAESSNGTPGNNGVLSYADEAQVSTTREEFEQAVAMSASKYSLTGELESKSPSNFLASVITLVAVAIMILGLALDNIWVGYLCAFVALFASLRMI